MTKIELMINKVKKYYGHLIAIEVYGVIKEIMPVDVRKSGAEILICGIEQIDSSYRISFEYIDYKNIVIREINDRKRYFDGIFKNFDPTDIDVLEDE